MNKNFLITVLIALNLTNLTTASSATSDKVLPSTDYSELWAVTIPGDIESLRKTIALASEHGYLITQTIESEDRRTTCLIFKVPVEDGPDFDDFKDTLPQPRR